MCVCVSASVHAGMIDMLALVGNLWGAFMTAVTESVNHRLKTAFSLREMLGREDRYLPSHH